MISKITITLFSTVLAPSPTNTAIWLRNPVISSLIPFLTTITLYLHFRHFALDFARFFRACDDFSTARTRTLVSVWLSFCGSSSFFSMSSSSIASVTPPCSPVALNSSSCPAVQSVGKRRRFSSDDEIALFKVLSHQEPFKWGSTVWESVALNLCHSGRDFTPRLCREKLTTLIKDFIKADNIESRQ